MAYARSLTLPTLPSRSLLAAGLTAIGLIFAGAPAAKADPGQEQACAGAVAHMQGIPMSQLRVAHTNGSRAGIAEVILEFYGGAARCMVDKSYNILDIRWNHQGGISHPGGSSHADKRGQEQACAGYFANQMSTAMSSVRVKKSEATRHGNVLVTVSVPGMTGRCNVDAHYNVVGFQFLGDQ